MTDSQPHGDQRVAVVPAVLRPAAGAQYLGICLNTFEKLARSNAFPMVRIGEKAVGALREDLDAYLRSRRFWAGGQNAGQASTTTTS